MSEVIIRKATKEDLPELSPLWKAQSDFHYELDPIYYSPTSPDEDTHFAAYFTKALATNVPYFHVAETDGKFVGFISYQKSRATYLDTNIVEFGEVLELFVHADYRKHGIGKMLIGEAEKFFKDAGLAYLRLEPSAFNPNAIQFYKNNGFVTRQEIMFKKIS